MSTQKVRTSQIPLKTLIQTVDKSNDIKDPPVVYVFRGRQFKDSGPKKGVYTP